MTTPMNRPQLRRVLLMSALAMMACDGLATVPLTTVAGLVVAEGELQGTVSLRDSSSTPQERSTALGSGGSYVIDLTGLRPPFVLRAEVTTAHGPAQFYSIPGDEIATNLSELSTSAVAASTRSERAEQCYEARDHGGATYARTYRVLLKLREVLEPLFTLYQVPEDPFGDDGMDSELKALLRDITISVSQGKVVVKNRATGAIIFEGSLKDLASGIFHEENMPAGPGEVPPPSTNGVALYAASCARCHGPLPGDLSGVTAAEIDDAIKQNEGGMGKLRRMTAAQLEAVAQALASDNPPTTCTSFTYSAWSACSNGTQTRTVASSSPSGCTGGNPVLSQSCSSLDGAALYGSKCSRCHGALATSDVKGASASAISGKHGTKYGTAEETAAIAAALK